MFYTVLLTLLQTCNVSAPTLGVSSGAGDSLEGGEWEEHKGR